LEAGVEYAIDLRNTGTGDMYWMRADTNDYAGGNIYVIGIDTGTERFDPVEGDVRRDAALALYAASLADGDFNNDGFIDTADYVALRKQNLPDGDYNIWFSNFGEPSPGAGGSSNTSRVPEPTTLVLAACGACLVGCRRRAN
jgi:hypothetical protein